MPNKKSYQLTIKGRVQNVGFRYHTHEKAIQLGVKGLVMNKPNGDVYVEAEGDEFQMVDFIAWCKKGPNWAKVVDVLVCEQPVCGFNAFEIKR